MSSSGGYHLGRVLANNGRFLSFSDAVRTTLNARFLRFRSISRLSQMSPSQSKSARPFLSKRHANGHGVIPIVYEPEGKLPRRSKLNGGDEFKVVAALKGKER